MSIGFNVLHNLQQTDGRCSVCKVRELKWMDHEPEGCNEQLQTDENYRNHMTIGTPWKSDVAETLGDLFPSEMEYIPPTSYYAGGPYVMTTYNPESQLWECNHGGMCEECAARGHAAKDLIEKLEEKDSE